MNNAKEMTTNERVNEVKRFTKCTFKNYKQTILSRGNSDDVAIAKISDDLVDAICNRGIFDSNGCLIAVQYKASRKRN